MYNRPGSISPLHTRTAWPLARCATGLKCILMIKMHRCRYLSFKNSLPPPKSLSCGTRAWSCLLPRYVTGHPVRQRAIRLCIQTGVGHPCGTYTFHVRDTNPCLFLMAILLRALRCLSIISTYTRERWTLVIYHQCCESTLLPPFMIKVTSCHCIN